MNSSLHLCAWANPKRALKQPSLVIIYVKLLFLDSWALLGLVWCDWVRFGMDEFGLVWMTLVWCCWVWFGMDEFVLVWLRAQLSSLVYELVFLGMSLPRWCTGDSGQWRAATMIIFFCTTDHVEIGKREISIFNRDSSLSYTGTRMTRYLGQSSRWSAYSQVRANTRPRTGREPGRVSRIRDITGPWTTVY